MSLVSKTEISYSKAQSPLVKANNVLISDGGNITFQDGIEGTVINKNGLTTPSITTGSITVGDTTISNFNQFVVKNKNGEIEETLCLKGNIRPALDDEKTFIDLGYEYNSRTGALIALRSIDYDDEPGSFSLVARDEENSADLKGYPNGLLSWNDTIYFNGTSGEGGSSILCDQINSHLAVGYAEDEGAKIRFYSATNSNDSDKGKFSITAQKDSDNVKYLIGKPDGTLTWNSSNVVTYSLLNNLKSSIYFNAEDSTITSRVVGFTPQTDGARLALYSKNHETWTGVFSLVSVADDKTCALTGRPTGSLTWNNNQVITNYSTSHIYFDHTAATSRDIGFSTSNNNTKRGAYMTFKSGSDTSAAGHFIIQARDETNATLLQGRPGGTLTWGGSTIYTAGNLTGGVSTIATSNLTASRALISNSSGKVAVSAVTSTELGYLDGVTSNIQTQLNAKQASISGGASTIATTNLTASRALISNSSGKVAVSAVTSTELGYLDGVTSAIQTQLNSKIGVSAYWKSGNNWYRKYSDGFIEQGGRIDYGSQATNWTKSVTLNTAFGDSNSRYNVIATVYDGDSTGDRLLNYGINVYSQTTSSFQIKIETGNNVRYISWYACGY